MSSSTMSNKERKRQEAAKRQAEAEAARKVLNIILFVMLLERAGTDRQRERELYTDCLSYDEVRVGHCSARKLLRN